jgi:hypothetical protein
VNAIIFLAPISTFDQVLAEVGPLPPKVARLGSISPKDPHVNRLEDSLLLWKSIVSNKLLSDVNIILFLNKCDLLQVCSHPQILAVIALTFCQAKLDAGARLNQHMASYGDRPNDYDSISNCALPCGWFRILLSSRSDFRNKFGALHQSYTPNRERELYSKASVATPNQVLI